MTIETRVRRQYQTEYVTYDLDLLPDTVASLDHPTRRGYGFPTKGEELQQFANRICEIMANGVYALQLIACQHELRVTEGWWLHHDGWELVTEIEGINNLSRHDIADQLNCTARAIHEVERQISAMLGRDVRVVFANAERVEFGENLNFAL